MTIMKKHPIWTCVCENCKRARKAVQVHSRRERALEEKEARLKAIVARLKARSEARKRLEERVGDLKAPPPMKALRDIAEAMTTEAREVDFLMGGSKCLLAGR